MAKKEYFQRIYLRAEETILDHFKYIYLVDSKNGGLAWVTANSLTHLRMHNREPKHFASIEEAEKYRRIMDVPNCEVISKWVPKPVSSAQRSLSRQYCQRKRQLAGAAAILKGLCQASVSKDKLDLVLAIEDTRLNVWYKQELARIGAEK